jgi:hypothetical protein
MVSLLPPHVKVLVSTRRFKCYKFNQTSLDNKKDKTLSGQQPENIEKRQLLVIELLHDT